MRLPAILMRKLIKYALTESEAETIRTVTMMQFDHPLVERMVNVIKNVAPDAAITPKSYARVESKADGHDWHTDQGDRGHMKWCAYSGSVLLTNDFVGGNLEFADGTKHRHYLDLLIFSSDERHRVLPHGDGKRMALLIFLGRENGE